METKEVDKKENKPFIIANPIYDTVFKRLMEDVRIVKFFLSTILKQPVVSVDVLPQEFTYQLGNDEKNKDDKDKKEAKDILYSVFRVDFKATVLTEDGIYRKVLIEVQKSLGMIDVSRFRQYLGNQYLKTDSVIVNNSNENMMLPITTIYIIGNKLSDMKCARVKVKRVYTDLDTEEPTGERSDVVEKLTHDSYFIQIGRITDNRYSTRLEKLFSIFEQAYFVKPGSEAVKNYPYQPGPEDEEIKLITGILHEMGVDPAERKRIEDEEEAIRTIRDTYAAELLEERRKREEDKKKHEEEKRKLAEEEKRKLEEKDKTIEEKDKIIEEEKKKREEDKRKHEEEEKRKLEEKDKIIEEEKKKHEEEKKKREEKDKEVAALLEKIAEMERLSRNKQS